MRTPAQYEDLTAVQRKRIAFRLVARSLLTVTLMFVGYFVLPMRRPADAGVVVLVVGLLVLAMVFAWQIRAILGSPFPRLRAFETLTVGLPLLLVVFASGYYVLSAGDPTSFSQPMDKVGAMYLTVTVFSTVGFGDITPSQDLPRLLVSLQMLVDLAVFGLVAKLILGAVERNLRRRGPAAHAGEPEPSAP